LSRRTIWIIISSRKGGHTYPCRAIYSYILARADGYHPQMINVLDLSWPLSLLDRLGRSGDLKLRSLYRSGYHGLQKDNQVLKSMYRFTENMVYHYSKVKEKLVRIYGRPDLVVSVQPEVNVVAALFKSWFRAPFHTVIIDLAIHGLWINNFVDNYCVANEPLKHELIAYGVPENRITVAGMPLRNGFSTVGSTSIKEMRKRLGLSPNLHTVLLIGGLLGKMLDFEGAIKAISDVKIPIQIVAVFGENEVARNHAQELKDSYKYPMHLYRTVTNMHELMWASDLVISKPGSVTIAEVLSLGKPLVAVNPLAGSAQELRFAQFLQENGAGFWIKDMEELSSVLRRIISNRAEYVRMSRNARKLGQCGLTANQTILENIKRSLEKKEDA
jgi:processive 1,2-diacylglycerol beta-glucosyltransferase